MGGGADEPPPEPELMTVWASGVVERVHLLKKSRMVVEASM